MGWLDGLRDRSIFYSFDRSGFRRHQRDFVPGDLDRDLSGEVCLVTGANAGLGRAVATGLAARRATVHLLCRNAERGAEARDAIARETGNEALFLEVVDLSNLDDVRAFTDRFDADRVDLLIHNAGLLPLERELTADGLELTVATHLVGPHLLTARLRPKLRDARVIFVSSGGMYAKRFDLDALLDTRGPYDGVAAYALTKRGQVILAEQWAQELASSGTTVNAMHPGWAATGGVERSLPRFWRFMRDRLRTAEEGADTALWLGVAARPGSETGKFWFDRRVVSTHLLPWTRETAAQRQGLWDFCDARAGLGTAAAARPAIDDRGAPKETRP